jgi:hypothetical protein
VKHIVALSGGKDSTAMAVRLAEIEPRPYSYVCTPTGDEPVAMFEHWARLESLLGAPILRLQDPRGLRGLIREQKALPNWRQRWCTRILKLEPYFDWLEEQAPAVSYVGLRADEPSRDGFDIGIPGVATDCPFRRWGWRLADVVAYLGARGISIPKRTDCRRCFFQRLIEWWEFWHDDPEGWAEAEEDEASTGHTFRSPGRDSWPASLSGLRARFEAGDIPRETRSDPLAGLKCRVCSL